MTRSEPDQATPKGFALAKARARESRPGLGLSTYLERAAFYLLLLLIATRPMLDEKYDSALHSIERASGATDICTPATTAVFDSLIWLAGLMSAVSLAMSRKPWRWTGAELGWIVLVLAAVLSTMSASNRRLAANASVDWLTTIAMLFMLANLCRDRSRVALVLAVVVASGVASFAKSAMQVGVEFQELSAHYREQKEQFWQKQNIPLDDPRVELFEHRINAQQAMGFFPHSNAQGAFLSMAGFAVLGLMGFQHRRAQIAFKVIAFLLFGMIVATGSMGALMASVAGLLLWFVWGRIGPWVQRNWQATFFLFWSFLFASVLVVAAIGFFRGGLPGRSLNFRWQYWQVTTQIIRDHSLTGTGALNFDRAYLAIKPITYPEEIRDPHNFVLSIIAQWGLLGGIGLLLVLLGGSFGILRARWGGTGSAEGGPVVSWRVSFLLALFASFIIFRLILMRHLLFSGDIGQQAMVFFDIGLYGLIWMATMALSLWTTKIDDRINLASRACLCCTLTFLLHNTIEFAIFYPGTLTPFIALAAVLFVNGSQPTQPSRSALWLLLVCLVALASVFTCVYWPVSHATDHLAQARNAETFTAAEAHYLSAAQADPLDPTPLVELAEMRAPGRTLDQLDGAVDAINQAAARDRDDLSIARLKMHIFQARYQISHEPIDLLAAIAAARTAVSLYPESPDGHLQLAEILAQVAGELNGPDLSAEAVSHFQRALQLDDARPVGEIRRWPQAWRDGVQQRITKLRAVSTQTSPER